MSRSAVIRALAATSLLFAVVGATNSIHTEAAAKTKNYASSQYHFKLSYPATWTLQAAAKTSDVMGPAEAKVNPTCLVITSPDQRGLFNVLVQRSGASVAQIKASESAFLKEGASLVGSIKFATQTSSGMQLVMASATDKVDATHNAAGVIIAASNGHLTWYSGMAYVEGYPASKQDNADLQAIMSSFTPD